MQQQLHLVQMLAFRRTAQMAVRVLCEPAQVPSIPAGNAAALTITPLAGGTRPVSAHLVIVQL